MDFIKHNLVTYLSLLLLGILSSCLGDSTNTPTAAPTPIACTDTGFLWKANYGSNCFNTRNAYYRRNNLGKANFYAKSNEESVFEFSLDSIYVDTFLLTSTGSHRATFIYGSRYYNSSQGQLIITMYDRINEKISGQFSFIGNNTLNGADQVSISKGEIRKIGLSR